MVAEKKQTVTRYRILAWIVVFACSTLGAGYLAQEYSHHTRISFNSLLQKRFLMHSRNNNGFCGPRFIVIGAQKGGTTSLWKYAKQLDWVQMGRAKELHFFDKLYRANKDHLPLDDIQILQAEYLKNFGMEHVKTTTNTRDPGYYYGNLHTCTDTRTGLTFSKYNTSVIYTDITPRYMIVRQAPKLIKDIANDPWVLALLREPASRALSLFRMEFREEDVYESYRSNMTFFAEEFHRRVKRSINMARLCLIGFPAQNISDACSDTGLHHNVDLVWRGLYSIHLRNWIEVFGIRGKRSDKFIIWISEHFSTQPKQLLLQLQQNIMGSDYPVDRIVHELDFNERYNVDAHVTVPWNKSMIALREFYQEYAIPDLIEALSSWGYKDAVEKIQELWGYTAGH